MKKILIIGSGNVAHHLSIALKNSGFEISQIFSRNLITSKKLASKIGCDFTSEIEKVQDYDCLLYTSPSPRDLSTSRMPSSA